MVLVHIGLLILASSVGVFSAAGGGRGPGCILYNVITPPLTPPDYADEVAAAASAIRLRKDEAAAVERRPSVWLKVTDKRAALAFSPLTDGARHPGQRSGGDRRRADTRKQVQTHQHAVRVAELSLLPSHQRGSPANPSAPRQTPLGSPTQPGGGAGLSLSIIVVFLAAFHALTPAPPSFSHLFAPLPSATRPERTHPGNSVRVQLSFPCSPSRPPHMQIQCKHR